MTGGPKLLTLVHGALLQYLYAGKKSLAIARRRAHVEGGGEIQEFNRATCARRARKREVRDEVCREWISRR